MNFVLGIIIVMFSILKLALPEFVLQFQDIFRIRGKREYTSFAITMTRFAGFFGIFIGIYYMYTATL